MFQRLISLTPVSISREIDNIQKTLPLSLTQRLLTNPSMKETVIAEVFREFSSNQVLKIESRNGHSQTASSSQYPYIQQAELQLLVRHTLLQVLPDASLEGSVPQMKSA